jgi:AcrR family transcriptional regulator
VSSKGQRTRHAILQATWKLLKSHGAARIRMADVASEAGVSRQALYLHFPSRTSLMLALVEHISKELGADELFEPAKKAPTGREALEASLRASARFHVRLHEVATALDLARHTDEAAAAAWQERMAARRQAIRRLVSRVNREGGLLDGWKVGSVVDALWALSAPRMYADLVVERGWSVAEYERFLVTCAAQFLR